MDLDAELGAERLRVHVAPRSRAEEHDVLQPRAGAGHGEGQGGVVDERDLRSREKAGQILGHGVRIGVDRERRILGTAQSPRHRRQGLVGIHEHGAHRALLVGLA